eukprot:g2194.t1
MRGHSLPVRPQGDGPGEVAERQRVFDALAASKAASEAAEAAAKAASEAASEAASKAAKAAAKKPRSMRQLLDAARVNLRRAVQRGGSPGKVAERQRVLGALAASKAAPKAAKAAAKAASEAASKAAKAAPLRQSQVCCRLILAVSETPACAHPLQVARPLHAFGDGRIRTAPAEQVTVTLVTYDANCVWTHGASTAPENGWRTIAVQDLCGVYAHDTLVATFTAAVERVAEAHGATATEIEMALY